MAAVAFSTGDSVGKYRLDTHLGGGSFGSVWRAVDGSSGDVVAIKLLTATATAEVRAEIELLAASASSRSSHVVRVLGGGTDPVPYIVMEYIEGSDLAELLTERGKLTIREVIDIGLALSDALSALNSVGIVHRDVKPGNTMIDAQGTIKLADFGIAKIAGYASVTTTRQAPMTMAYAAPEVWQDEAVHRSDLYAMGCVLYQCLVGTPPFMANIHRLMYMHLNDAPELEKLPPETPASLRDLIRRCLAKSVDDRPADAAECTSLLNRAAVELAQNDPTGSSNELSLTGMANGLDVEPDILQILRDGESETAEFKTRLPPDDRVARDLVGFANSLGGVLVVGVGDRGEPTGLSEDEALITATRLARIADALFTWPTKVGVTELYGKSVVYAMVGRVPTHLRPATTAHGEAFIRTSNGTAPFARPDEQSPPPLPGGRPARVFVAMSFRQNEEPALVDYREAMQRAAERTGLPLELVLMNELGGDFEISQRIMEEIDRADIVIADFTLSPANVYFELGFARGRGKSIIQTARQGTPLEFDVRNWKTSFFKNATELESKLIGELTMAYGRLWNSPQAE